jgi:hypothetical protein
MKTHVLTLMPSGGKPFSENLTIAVPCFGRGIHPPPAAICTALLPEGHAGDDLPIYCRETLIRDVAQDEADFRRTQAADWRERCWFLSGTVAREPCGRLWGSIERIVPARRVRATAGSFEFSAETWSDFYRDPKARGEVLMGWLHTHSLAHLEEKADGSAEHWKPGASAGNAGPDGNTRKKMSGLFLSGIDRDSARRRGFNGPHHITAVLDSDVCVLNKAGSDLGEMLGVWGWFGLRLARRSLYIVHN